ncbi:MAG: polysaccharide deacetylase family protein [Lachnospiraceae bacterium]|nr:polysaccharide deacetylase family protein [Lachnospiraceae bacterium]
MNDRHGTAVRRAARALALCFALFSLFWLCACSSAGKTEAANDATLPAGIFPAGTDGLADDPRDVPATAAEPSAAPAPTEPTEPPVTAPAGPTEPPAWRDDPRSVTDLDAELPGFDYSPYLPVPQDVSRGSASLSYLYAHGGVTRAGSGGREIALTFSLAAESGYTGQLLDVLREKQVPATFLITLRDYLQSDPEERAETVRRIVREGHLVSSHGYTHIHSTLATNRRFLNELVLYRTELDALLRYHYPVSVFSDPYEEIYERDVYLCDLMGFRFLGYSFIPADDNGQAPVYMVLPQLKNALSPGAVIRMGISAENVKAVSDFIEYAQAQGYQFVLPVHAMD